MKKMYYPINFPKIRESLNFGKTKDRDSSQADDDRLRFRLYAYSNGIETSANSEPVKRAKPALISLENMINKSL